MRSSPLIFIDGLRSRRMRRQKQRFLRCFARCEKRVSNLPSVIFATTAKISGLLGSLAGKVGFFAGSAPVLHADAVRKPRFSDAGRLSSKTRFIAVFHGPIALPIERRRSSVPVTFRYFAPSKAAMGGPPGIWPLNGDDDDFGKSAMFLIRQWRR
jgi:hypothetical protein